jgi:predicted secreted protein
LEGIAGWAGDISGVIDVIRDSGAGILQMECPEMLYEGIGRFDKSVEQYDCAAFRSVCERILANTLEQIVNYRQWGYDIPVIVALDGSPTCGWNCCQSAPEWRGLVAETEWKKPRYIQRRGILMEMLETKMKELGLTIPILGIPEVPELGDMNEAVKELKAILA